MTITIDTVVVSVLMSTRYSIYSMCGLKSVYYDLSDHYGDNKDDYSGENEGETYD